MYGTTWCGDCHRAKALLDDLGVGYEWVNIEEVEGASERMLELNGGIMRVPTLIFPDGSVLVEPTNDQLLARLREQVA